MTDIIAGSLTFGGQISLGQNHHFKMHVFGAKGVFDYLIMHIKLTHNEVA